MVKVNILQLLTVYVLQFTLHLLFSFIIGSVEVSPDIDMKFHQEVMEIVSYDNINLGILIRKSDYNRIRMDTNGLHKNFPCGCPSEGVLLK